MKVHFLRTALPLVLALLGVLTGARGSAQGEAWEQQLARAESLIASSQSDSAVAVLDRLYADLPAQGDRAVEDFKLLVRLHRAQALTDHRKYKDATNSLLRLIDDTRDAAHYELMAEAYLLMALIYQRQRQPTRCLHYLRLAENQISTRNLRPLVPKLENRRAAYHRNFNEAEASLYHARKALAVARELDDSHQLALAHFNLSLYYRESDTELSEYHLEQAARYYKHTGSASDYLIMTLVLNELRIKKGNMQAALATNDSAMLYVSRVVNKDSTFLSRIYDYRSTILQALGQQDSAFHYLKLSHAAQIEHLERVNRERATEIEAQYVNEKNKALIVEQQHQLARERERRHRLILLAVGGFLLLLASYYYFTRLSQAREAIEQQHVTEQHNRELADSLQEQKMLRGEVHHRVKNNLQIIESLIQMQIKNMPDLASRASLESMSGRIYSMAAVHEILYQQGRAGEINFREYAEKICQHFLMLSELHQSCDFHLDFKDYWFNLETAIPLGTMFNELLTNSFKYARPDDGPLRITVRLTETPEHLILHYRDNGGGFSATAFANEQGGLGTYLLRGMSRQLRGRMETENNHGAITRIYFRRKNEHKTEQSTYDVPT